MQIKLAFYAIIVFSMVMVATGVIIGEWNDAYDSGLDNDLGEFNKLSDVSADAESQKGKINPQSGEASSDFETGMFRGGYGIITNIFEPLRVIFGDGGMLDSITERFGIPDYVRQGLTAIMIFGLIFAIIAIIFRLGRSSA